MNGDRQNGRLCSGVGRVATLVGVVTVVVALATAAGAGPVTETLAAHGDDEDFEPPEVTETTREGTTTIELRLSDNHDVDEDTIDASDFSVSPGSVSDIGIEASGTDAIVTVTLEDGVGNQAVTISSNNDTDITDTNGNEFDPTGQFSEVVPAPDDPPQFESASRINATAVEVHIVDDEGVDVETIEKGDFTINRSSIESATATTDGPNATVVLRLHDDVGMDPVLLGITNDADIKDEDGTVIETNFRDIRVGGVSPPELVNVTKRSDTEIELYFVDEAGVAGGSVQTHDILVAGSKRDGRPVSELVSRSNLVEESLWEYQVADVRVARAGKNATVVLELPRPVDEDELLVRIRDGAVITDIHGHALDPTDDDTMRQAVVTGMDGQPPDIETFTVTGGSSGTATVTIVPSERLAGLNVSVGEPVGATLDRSAFTFEESQFAYVATHTADTEGTLTFRLENATDEAGNTRERFFDSTRSSAVDRSSPDPVVAIDFEQSRNLTLTFDARHTRDLTGVASYTWSFEDGTNATGQRTTKTFEPGTHTVSLTAIDTEGRASTETVTLALEPGVGDGDPESTAHLDGVRRAADPTVTVVQPEDGPAETALLEFTQLSPGVGVSVAGETTGGLAASSDVKLVDIEVVSGSFQGYTLGVSASGASSVTDAADATDTRAVGGFTIAHDAPDSAFESVTLHADVDTDRLAELDADPSDVVVFRQHDGEWNRLETSHNPDESDGETVRVRAETPGLSRFVVAVEGQPAIEETPTPTPTPADDSEETPPTPTEEDDGVVVTNATLSESSVDPGETVIVNATIENRDEGNTVYIAGLSVNGTTVATESVTLPAGTTESVSFEYVPESAGVQPVAVNGTAAGELTVGGGGLFASVLGVFSPILGLLSPVGGLFGTVAGFVPLGLVRPVVIFVGLPLCVLYLILKGLAIYLGY